MVLPHDLPDRTGPLSSAAIAEDSDTMNNLHRQDITKKRGTNKLDNEMKAKMGKYLSNNGRSETFLEWKTDIHAPPTISWMVNHLHGEIKINLAKKFHPYTQYIIMPRVNQNGIKHAFTIYVHVYF